MRHSSTPSGNFNIFVLFQPEYHLDKQLKFVYGLLVIRHHHSQASIKLILSSSHLLIFLSSSVQLQSRI